MKKKQIITYIVTAVIIFAAVFAVMNGLPFFSDGIKTVHPEKITSSEYLEIDATVIREETLITTDAGGSAELIFEDGERVRSDTVVANIYQSGADISVISKMESLREKISSLEKLNDGNLSYRQDALKLENDICDLMLAITEASCKNSFSAIPDYCDRLYHYFNIKQILLGEVKDFSEKIASLKAELSELEKSAPKKQKSILSGSIGYFTSAFDGYEKTFTLEKIKSLSVSAAIEYLSAAPKTEKPNGYIGKTVNDSVWRIAVPMTAETAQQYGVGKRVKIEFPDMDNLIATADVIYMNTYREDGIVIFEGVFNVEKFVGVRRPSARIVLSSSNCLSLPASALLKNDNDETGVYVLIGQQVVFKPVTLVKYDGGSVYVRPADSSGSRLSEHDEVIYSGKNLFDGRIIG